MKLPNLNLIKSKIALKRLSIPQSKKAMLKLLLAIFLLSCVIGGVKYFIDISDNPKKEKLGDIQLTRAIDEVNKPNVSCQEAIDKIGNESTEGRSLEVQKKLLQHQMLCFGSIKNYDKAIEVGEKLKALYEKEGDMNNSAFISSFLSGYKESKKLKESEKNVTPNSTE